MPMKKILLFTLAILAGGILGWLSTKWFPVRLQEIGSRSVPVVETNDWGSATALNKISNTFGGAGSASTTFSWSGGDAARMFLATKCQFATCTVEAMYEMSHDGTNFYGVMQPTTTAELSPTSTFTLINLIHRSQPGNYRATTSQSWLVDHLRNALYLRVLLRKAGTLGSGDDNEDVKGWLEVTKEEQQ